MIVLENVLKGCLGCLEGCLDCALLRNLKDELVYFSGLWSNGCSER